MPVSHVRKSGIRTALGYTRRPHASPHHARRAARRATRSELHVAVPATEFEKAIDAAFRKLAREVKIPGFRPGKAPRRLLEARFGTDIAREEALQRLAAALLRRGGRDASSSTRSRRPRSTSPRVRKPATSSSTPSSRCGRSSSSRATTGCTVELPDVGVADEAVDAPGRRAARALRRPRGLDRPLTDGDYAQIDIKGYIHDEVVDALTATDFLYEVGSGARRARARHRARGQEARATS